MTSLLLRARHSAVLQRIHRYPSLFAAVTLLMACSPNPDGLSSGSAGPGGEGVAGALSANAGMTYVAGGGGAGTPGDLGGAPSSAGTDSAGGAAGATASLGGAGPQVPARFSRGINFGNRLDATPNEGDWGPVLRASDFTAAAARGFDHVRLPVRFSAHADATAPYSLEQKFLQRVDWAVKTALDAGLAIVVDLHHYEELHADPSAHRDRFLGIWRQLSEHFSSAPAAVAFELLNEPAGEMNASIWNELATETVRLIRERNPQRLLIVDSVNFASVRMLEALSVAGAGPLMAAVHLYEPTLFTFQGQEWMGPIWSTTGVVFPGPPSTPAKPSLDAEKTPWAKKWFDDYNSLPTAENPSGPKAIQEQIDLVVAFRTRTGWPVYNGEWGPQNLADSTSRSRYVAAMREACEAAGVGWAIWEDGGSMRLIDTDGQWDESVLDALIPR